MSQPVPPRAQQPHTAEDTRLEARRTHDRRGAAGDDSGRGGADLHGDGQRQAKQASDAVRALMDVRAPTEVDLAHAAAAAAVRRPLDGETELARTQRVAGL